MGRPSTPLINKDEAVRAALAIIDSEGLEALTMRRLAQKLNVSSPGLYHHFRNKDEVLRGVAALILHEIPGSGERTEPWTDVMARTAAATRRVLSEHPNAVPIMARYSSRSVTPKTYEQFGLMLLKRGVPVDMVDVIVTAFETLVLGSATLMLAREQEEIAPPEDAEDSPIGQWEQANPRSDQEVFELLCRTLGNGLVAYIASGE